MENIWFGRKVFTNIKPNLISQDLKEQKWTIY